MGKVRLWILSARAIELAAVLSTFSISPVWAKPAYSIPAGNESDMLFCGVRATPKFGLSVAPQGDVNNNGHADFAIGAPGVK